MSTPAKRFGSFEERRRQRIEEARQQIVTQIIDGQPPEGEIDLTKTYSLSKGTLPGYVTLDDPHIQDIRKIRTAISRFAGDRSRGRPLNIMMQAEPGSGKSHFVKCLAASLTNRDASAVDFNMASMQNIEDMIQPLDALRNLKVQDRLPILFIDEFDSDLLKIPLLLPLLWDGELNIAHRNLKLGKLVIILAGSGKTIAEAITAAKAMRPDKRTDQGPEGKLVDLLSRINGGELSIPPLDLVEDGKGRDRRVDKVCLTISLLESRFGSEVELVPVSLLRFVAKASFRYGVRSLAHLIDLAEPIDKESKTPNAIDKKQLRFPLTSVGALRNSSLSYHLVADDGPSTIVDAWKEASAFEAVVRIQEKPVDDDIPF